MSIRLTVLRPLLAILLAACVAPASAGDQRVLLQLAQAAVPAAPKADTARTFRAGSLTISAPWLRATPKGATVAGGYMRISNSGPAADRLIGGTTPFAARFEMHEMSVTDGVMRMRPLADGLEIKPGESVELKPGGLHVMFVDLKEAPKQGETLKGTLVFEKAGSVEIEYRVEPIGAPGPSGAKAHAPKHAH